MNYFQSRKSEQNLMLLNLIVSELCIAIIGIPADLYNSITRGIHLDKFVCPFVGFIHTFFGKYILAM